MTARQKAIRWFLLLLGGVAIVCVVFGTVLLVWRGPWWLDREYLDPQHLRTQSAALVTGFRTAVVQLLAVLGAGIALLFTAFNYRLTRYGQVTDRFIKALERLDSEELHIRIGGILALEQIIQDAPDQAAHAARVLVAFIRHRTPRRSTWQPPSLPPRLPAKPEADVQQALTALTNPVTRRHIPPTELLDLTELHLRNASLRGADLNHAQLNNADLTGADLHEVRLTDADLRGAQLAGAELFAANLTDADLRGAQLADAKLFAADLTDADLRGANLARASLRGANLARTNLRGANLAHTNLRGANFTRANLRGANLTRANLHGGNLTRANLHGTNLADAALDGAKLSTAAALTLEQVVTAFIDARAKLPPELAQDPRVRARIEEREV